MGDCGYPGLQASRFLKKSCASCASMLIKKYRSPAPTRPSPHPIRGKGSPRERGRPARILMPLWRLLSVSATWQAATRSAGTATARPKKTHGAVPGRSKWRRWPRLRQALCGRDARAPGWAIVHTLNREHGLHHARESGRAPFASLKNHSPLEGKSARPGRSPQSSRRWAIAAFRK